MYDNFFSKAKVEHAPSEIAIDPICQMEVEVATAKFKHEFDGDMYYFCCAGCQMRFSESPRSYLQPAVATISLGDIMIL